MFKPNKISSKYLQEATILYEIYLNFLETIRVYYNLIVSSKILNGTNTVVPVLVNNIEKYFNAYGGVGNCDLWFSRSASYH